MDAKEEQQLRGMIRKELENRERLRSGASLGSDGDAGINDERRRIINEEINNFYVSKGGYKPFTNDQGDVEWLTEAEAVERERQIPVDMEELEAGQRRVRVRMVLITIMFVVVVTLLLLAMRDRYGSVQVLCNVADATIVLDGAPTEFRTDFKLEKLPPGVHLISVYKSGYVPDGLASTRVDLEAGGAEVIALKLKLQEPTSSHGR